jgi:hypothetical protein
MDKTIRVYASRKEMKADEYRYWQSRPVHERTSAVAELTRAAYTMKEPARMFDGFKKLFSVFNAHSVKYLVVGGYGVSFHAQPRATKNLDLFIKADTANAKATLFTNFHRRIRSVTTGISI